MIGFVELLALLILFGNQLGVPLGVPPGPDVPYLAAVAPDDCLFYAAWNGVAEVDPQANASERWIARPEIAAAAQQIRATLRTYVRKQLLAEEPQDELLADLLAELADYALGHATAVFAGDGGSMAERYVGVLIHAEPEFAEKMQASFARLQGMLPAEWKPREFQVDGDTYRALTLPEIPLPFEFAYGVRGEFIVLTWGQDAIPKICASGETPEPTWLSELKSDLAVARRSSVSFVQVSRLIEVAAEFNAAEAAAENDGGNDALFGDDLPPGAVLFEPPDFLPLLGIADIESWQAVAGLDAQGFITRQRLVVGKELRGLLAALEAKPLSDFQLRTLPADVDFGITLNLSIDQLLAFVDGAAEEIGEDLEAAYAQFRQSFGLDLRTDVLDQFDGMIAFSTPVDVANPGSGLLVQLGIEDEMAFSEVLLKFNGALEEMLAGSGAGTLQREDIEGVEVLRVDLPGDFFSFGMSWCLFDGRILLSGETATIAAYIRSAADKRLATSDLLFRQLLEEGQALYGAQPLGVWYQDSAQLIREMMGMISLFDQPEAPFDVHDLPTAQVLTEGVEPTRMAWYRTAAGFEVLQRQTIPSAAPGASVAAVTMASVPAIYGQAAGAKLETSKNQMRQLVLCMHNYHDAFMGLPTAYTVDAEGKPLLSWRVHVLPFLGYTELYDEFHLDEPWDSEHNRALIEQMPPEFAHPKLKLPAGHTVYLAATGKRGMLLPQSAADQEKFSRKLEEVGSLDGVSSTALLVEVPQQAAVVWTQPGDFDIDQPELADRLRGIWRGRIILGIGDGVIREISDQLSEEQLRAIFQIDDGDVIDWEALGK